MGANKTTKAIPRASQSGAGVHEIKWSFDEGTNIHKVSQTHSARSSVEDELMLQDLRKLRPFRVVSGRYHAHCCKTHACMITWQNICLHDEVTDDVKHIIA